MGEGCTASVLQSGRPWGGCCSGQLWPLTPFLRAHPLGGNPPFLAYGASFIHSLIQLCAFIESFLCARHFAECTRDVFPTARRHTPHTFSLCPQLFLILLFPWKIPLWSIPFSNKGRNKKRILLSSSLSWNSLCSDDPIYLFPGRSWLPLSRFILWMPKWGRFPAEAESIAGNLSCFPYWWWMAKFPESILDI